MKISPNAPCPCHSGSKYKKCCRALHQGRLPDSPIALMRSRYAAYALGDTDFIMQTTHPDSPHYLSDTDLWQQQLRTFSQQTQFIGLTVEAHHLEDDAESGTVRFRAILMQGDRDVSFTETSLFKKQDGRWLYLMAQE